MLQCCFHLCQSPAVLAAMAAGARPLAAQSSDWLSHALWKNMKRVNMVDDSTAQAGQLPPVPPPHLADTRIALRNDCQELVATWMNDFLSFSPLAVQLFRFHSVEHECTHGNRSVRFCRPVWKVDCKIATAISEKQISHFQNDWSASFLFV